MLFCSFTSVAPSVNQTATQSYWYCEKSKRYEHRAASELTHARRGNEGAGAEAEMKGLPALVYTKGAAMRAGRGAGVTIVWFARFTC